MTGGSLGPDPETDRAAPTDLDDVAHFFERGGLPDDAGIKRLAFGPHPVKDRGGAVGRVPFLVAGDQERD